MTIESGPGAEAATAAWPRQDDEPQTGPLVGSVVGDRCATCSAPLASDQRYCVQCGERRGKARFPVASSAPAATEPAPAAAAQHEPRRRVPSGATLVAGIATLLLAMGVGVEIGKTGSKNSSSPRASQPAFQVLTVGGGGAGAATTPTATTATKTKAKTPKKGAKNTTAAANKPIPTKVVTKAAAAASQVLGGSAPAKPTVQQGQSCTGGSANGCGSNGKFDGSFFGQ